MTRMSKREIELAQVDWRTHPQKRAAAEIFARVGYHKGTHAKGHSIGLICETFNDLTPSIVQGWLKDPDYLEYIQALSDRLCFKLVQRLEQICETLDFDAVKYSLEVNNPEVYDLKYRRDRANHLDRVALENLRMDKIREIASRPLPIILLQEDAPKEADE